MIMSERVNESAYRLKVLTESGYVRKKCKICNTYFWTRDPFRNVCCDSPCTDYEFFNLEIKCPPLSVRESRKKFIDFFKRHGHEYVKPRPVVARWREDLYLTIASIVVFQPFVTEGKVPPPANPLVISQPCIRLEDIDNVGLTFGRHLTSFEMAAHHAFNYPNKKVYWKERTVELAKEFFTEEIGIPEDELVFKESWWEGGGNAGPSFEVAVGGLELATLVFMQYKVIDGNYVELPLKIVDTGYGVERIAWFTQKSPTAFHAIYGGLVDTFHKLLDIPQPDKELLKVAGYYVSRIDPENPSTITNHRKIVAERLGIPVKEVEEQLNQVIKVYTLLDHSRTLAWMLGDGIVPSNAGEGYLARLVIRRALRTLIKMKTDITLKDLVLLQVKYWSQDFPKLMKMKDYILDVLEFEENKFKEVLKRGYSIVASYVRRRRKLGIEELVELYDSHGIPPEMVSDFASKMNIKITRPSNFYSLVAARHAKAPIKPVTKAKLPNEIIEWAKKLPSTKKLFHENSYLRTFEARVIDVNDKFLVLDQTAFYPEGGGQESDQGYILVSEEKVRVIDVQKIDEVIVHVLEKPVKIERGSKIKGVIDWNRRYKLMRHHTATHVLLGALRKVLGKHVWQAGAEKTVHKARLDVTHYKLPDRKQIMLIEKLANELVEKGVPVHSMYIHRNEAESKYGFIIYQGGVPEDPILRIVEIPNWDVEACFGTHLSNTFEIGGIKIINVEKIQDGVIRFEYVAGTQVVDYAAKLEDQLYSIGSILNTSPSEITSRLKSVMQEHEDLRKLLSRYRRKIIQEYLDIIEKNSKIINNIRYFILIDKLNDPIMLRDLMLKAIKQIRNILIAVARQEGDRSLIEIAINKRISKTIDLRELLSMISSKLIGVKGGGKRDHITLSVNKKVDKVVKDLENIIIEYLSRIQP